MRAAAALLILASAAMATTVRSVQDPLAAPAAFRAASAFDSLGDPLPQGAICRLGTNRLRHPVAVAGLAFAPDGVTLYSRGVDGEIRVWDSATGALLRTMAVPDATGNGLGITRDGHLLALCLSVGDAVVLDAQAGIPHPLPHDLGNNVTISPDGRWLAVWGRPTTKVSILTATDGQPHSDLDEAVTVFKDASFSADGSRIAIIGGHNEGTGASAREWRSLLSVRDPDSGRTLCRIEPADATLLCACFSPDGSRLFVGDSHGDVRVLDADTGAELTRFALGATGMEDPVSALAVSPDGSQLAVVDASSAVRLVDSTTGTCRQTLGKHLGRVEAVAFSPDGKQLATASRDQVVRLFDTATGHRLAHEIDFDSGIARVVVSPDGLRAATASADGSGVLWSLRDTGEAPRPFRVEGGLLDIAFTPDGEQLAVAATAGQLHVLDATTGRERGRWDMNGAPPALLIAFSPDGGTLAAVLANETMAEWTIGDDLLAPGPGAPVQRFTQQTPHELLSALAFSPDGTLVAMGSSRVALRDAQGSGELVRAWRGSSPISGLAFSPDGTLLATANADRTVRLADVATGEERGVLMGHLGRVQAIAFSPDGRWLASAGDDETVVRVWDVATRRQVATLRGHEAPVQSLAFVPDGHALISAGFDSAALVWAMPPTSEAGSTH